MSELLGRRHSYHCDGVFGTNPDSTDPEETAKQYIESAQRRMLSPRPIEPMRQSSMTSTLATEDSNGPCPVTNIQKKKSSKSKEKRKKSKPRRSGSRHSLSDHRDGSHKNNSSNTSEIRSLSGLESPTLVSPLVSPSGKESKKKKRSKKFRYNSEALGVVIVPDCDDAAAAAAAAADPCCDDDEKDVQNKMARFSSVTDLTQMLDDDDCTAFTKETAVTKDTTASKDTAMSKDTSIAVSRDTTVTNSVFKDTEKHSKKSSKKAKKLNKEKRTKSNSKTRRSSRLNIHNDNNSTKIETSNHGSRSGHGNGNESWGDDPEGDKTFMSQELLSLLALQIDDDSDHNNDNNGRHSLTKPPSNSSIKSTPPPPSLKKSNSFSGPKKTRRGLGARRSSVGNLNVPRSMETKTKDRPLRSKRFQEATNGTKNESWGATPSTTSSNRSPGSSSVYSAGLLNLYTASKKSKKSAPSPLLRRNVKSFSHVPAGESWRADPKRDDDIPSILFLSPENSHCNLLDESSSLGNTSNRNLSSSSTRRKKSIRRSSTSSSAAAAAAAAAGDNEEPQPLSSTTRSGSVSGALRRKSSTSKDNSCTTTSVGGSTPPRTMRRKSHNSQSSTSFRMRKNLTDPASSSLRKNESWAANTHSNNSPGSSSNIPGKRQRSSNVGGMRRKKLPSGNKNESWGMAGNFSDSRENLKKSGNKQQQKPPSMLSSNLVGMLMNDTGASPKAAELYSSKRQQQKQLQSPSAMKKSMSLGAMKHSPSLSTIKKSIANFKKFRGGTRNELKPIPNLAN